VIFMTRTLNLVAHFAIQLDRNKAGSGAGEHRAGELGGIQGPPPPRDILRDVKHRLRGASMRSAVMGAIAFCQSSGQTKTGRR
jgi:hypothetical protein